MLIEKVLAPSIVPHVLPAMLRPAVSIAPYLATPPPMPLAAQQLQQQAVAPLTPPAPASQPLYTLKHQAATFAESAVAQVPAAAAIGGEGGSGLNPVLHTQGSSGGTSQVGGGGRGHLGSETALAA